MQLLMTGATGKVGSAFLPEFLDDPRYRDWRVVALCNNRTIEASDRVSMIRGSLADRETVRAAMKGTTHVLHMAAVKESPDLVMDVAVGGMFHLLEEFRGSDTAEHFVLIGGDCVVGHIFHHHSAPITEDTPHTAYKGCYALTKVLEEVMLEQYGIQYGLSGTCLRAPWIMEKDDFRYALSFGEDQFGGPPWAEIMAPEDLAEARAGDCVPLLLDADGAPLQRNFVHVSDLVSAILSVLGQDVPKTGLFNIAMDEPVSYAAVSELLAARGYRPIEIPTRFFSNWLDNSRARQSLGWRPKVDLEALIERAWSYRRGPEDPRKIWYPG